MALPSASGSLRNLGYAARTSHKVRTGAGPPTVCAVTWDAKPTVGSHSVVGQRICARLHAGRTHADPSKVVQQVDIDCCSRYPQSAGNP
jgi:hypothetical protein